MSARWEQIRGLAATTRTKYRALLGFDPPLPLAVDDLAEQVFLCTSLVDPTLDPAIHGELNPVMPAIRLASNLTPTRRRFVIAHELGHLVIEGGTTLFLDDQSTLDERANGDVERERAVVQTYNTRERQEQEANLFALELLIPAQSLWQAIQQPRWTVEQLAATYGVSRDALRTQLINVCCLQPVTADNESTTTHVSTALDPEQQAAVGAPLPALVVAGPGTGKTRSIVAKYLALVDAGVDPASIVALTFSNAAAEDMRSRIIATLDSTHTELAGRVEVSTFHAWGHNFLKSYGTYVGLPLDFQLLISGDLFVFLMRHLADLPLEQYKALHNPGLNIRAIMQAISRAKDELYTPEEYGALVEEERERLLAASALETTGKTTKKAEDKRAQTARNAARLRELAAIYARYEALLRAEGIVDFGDLIMRSVAALRILEVAREAHARYQYILVDEFQDINYASGMLVALLDGGRGRVWAVGDPWQSIYRFRGASAANIAEFGSMYPSAISVSLVRNYRSVQGVIEASHRVMTGDPFAATRLVQQAQRPTARRHVVEEWEAEDQASEYAAIAHDILQHVRGRKGNTTRCVRAHRGSMRRAKTPRMAHHVRRPRFGDHAVLCRKHQQVAAIVATLEAHGIPVAGGGELLEYPEVKDLLAICAITRSLNDVGMLRVLTIPEFQLSAGDLEQLVRNADSERRSLQRATRDSTIVYDLSPEGQATLERLGELHDDLVGEHDAWRVLTRYLFDLSPTMRERIRRVERGDTRARRELANVGQLVVLARSFVRRALPSERHAAAFVHYARLLIEAGDVPKAAPVADHADTVHVRTIHAAKGLEWDTVYVPGLQKDVFPPRHQGSVIPEIGGLEHGPLSDEATEERYLLYVAMTRAKQRLILSRTGQHATKAIPRSPLLPLDPPWRVRYIPTGRACRTPRGETRLRGVPLQASYISASSIDTYEDCPRRYMYQYGFQLYDDVAPNLRMHQVIRAAADQLSEWMREEAPPDNATVEQLVRDLCRRYQLDGALYGADYIDTAIRHTLRIWHDMRDRPAIVQAINQSFVVQRPTGRVTVRVDRVEQSGDGTRFVRLKSGRAGKEDHLSKRIILYALAAQAHHPEARIAIHYTATNGTLPVDNRKDVLDRHTEKIDGILAGIAAESWEPHFGDQCDTCPFNLICPV